MSQRLAIEGGIPVNSDPVPPWPYFSEEMIQAAMEPLRTGQVNYWTGRVGMEFEQKFADWVGTRFGISTSNGTSALHVALASLGVGPGDEVITPSYTFIASSFCVLQAGAVPVFADVERETHTLSPESIRACLSPRTKAIIAVHLYGCMCDMDPIMQIAREHNLFVIEDCAQAHGGVYKGKKAGSIGHCNAFSFCQSKHFTTGGEGGCTVTDDEDVAWRCRSFRDHGYDVSERLRLLELEEKLPYIHNTWGYNYRMTEMQSAIGLECLKVLDNWNLANRRRNAAILDEALADEPYIWRLPVNTPERQNAYWLYPIILDTDKLRVDARAFFKAVAAEGVPAGPVLWPQCYQEKVYQEHNGPTALRYPFEDPNTRPEAVDYSHVHCDNAAWLEARTFFTCVHPTYEPEFMAKIAEAIRKVGRAWGK
jgi:dTDP-4-amino-4,6-dideoxygalactose transaminase